MSTDWLHTLSDPGRRELLDLLSQFLATHRRLTEQSELARLESDVLSASSPSEVITFLTAHAVHAAEAANLQMDVGDLAARMASLLQRELGDDG